MFKALVCAGLLVGAASLRAETWHFTYQGFHDTVTDTFLADRQLVGAFSGNDLDGDGTISRAEISSLHLHGHDYLACEAQSNEYWHCGTEAFSYALAGALHFTAGQYGSDPEGWVGAGHYFIAGEGEYGYSYRPGHDESWAYLWTDATTLAISPAPEPAAWAFLVAGLPLAWWMAWRRKNGTQ